MKKILSIAGAMIFAVVAANGQAVNNANGVQVIQNSNPGPIIQNTAAPLNSGPGNPANNPQHANPNKNATYNNNSLQYNKGNATQNNVPAANGSYDVPGAQGINNTNYNNNTPGTPSNNGVNGTYAQPIMPK